MSALFILLTLQGALGAFDVLYHHELTERLPWQRSAAKELKLHGVRNGLYALIFISLGWVSWHGMLAWLFACMLLAEVVLTLWDFVEEDRTRKLPASERVTHTLLALNYGMILALFAPVLQQWAEQPNGFFPEYHGVFSWAMTLFAAGVLIWGFRDYLRGKLLSARRDRVSGLPMLHKPGQHILITGGTGFIGKPLCRALIGQGHRVTVLTRDTEKAARLFTGRITLIDSAKQLREDDHFDVIVNLAGETIAQRWTAQNKREIMESRQRITHELLEYLATAKSRPEVFIHGSAIGIYGTSENMRFKEDTPPTQDVIGAFPREVCEAREQAALEVEKLGIRVCLLRTGIVLESDGGALAQMLFPFEFGLGGPLGRGRQWTSWIHREDLLRLILFLIDREEMRGPVNATAPVPVTNKAYTAALGRALKRPAFLPLPACTVRLLFGEMGNTLLLSGQHVTPAKALAHGFTFRYPDIDKALGAIFD